MRSQSLHKILIQLRVAYFIATTAILMLGIGIGILCIYLLVDSNQHNTEIKTNIHQQVQRLKPTNLLYKSIVIQHQSESELWATITEQLSKNNLQAQQCTVFRSDLWHANCTFSSNEKNQNTQKKPTEQDQTNVEIFIPLLKLKLMGHDEPSFVAPKTSMAPQPDIIQKSWIRLDTGAIKHYDDTLDQWR